MKTETLESYTNIAYFVAGMAGLLIYNNILFAVVMTLLSAGSFIYHKYKTPPIYKFDWYAMVVVITCLAGQLIDERWFWMALIAYQFVYAYFIISKLNVYVEVGIACVPLVAALFITKPSILVLIILAIFGIALYIRSKDNHENINIPEVHHDSKYHSWWHIITAIGFFLVIAF